MNEEQLEARRHVRANLLGLVDAGVGVQSVLFDRWDSWALLEMPGFAGPDSTWRAIALDDDVGAIGVRRGDTYEALPRQWGLAPVVVDVEVDTPRERELRLAPGAAGATLNEVLAETRRQTATLDVGVACHVLRALLARPAPSELVLVGFDGVVRGRGRDGGWQRAEESVAATRAWQRPDPEEVRARHLVDLVSALGLRSRERADARIKVRAAAEALAAHVAQALRVPSIRGDTEVRVFREGTARYARELFDAVDVVDERVVATLVRELFAERWRCEQRVLEAVLG